MLRVTHSAHGLPTLEGKTTYEAYFIALKRFQTDLMMAN